MSFAEQLRKARSLKYVTATDFVQSINKEYQEAGQKDFLSYSTYAAYENGKREPRLDQLAELARRLNVSLDTLLEVHPQEGDYDLRQYIKKLLISEECLLPEDAEYPDDKNFHIQTGIAKRMYIDKESCRKIVSASEKDMKDTIMMKLKELINERRNLLASEYTLPAASVIKQAAAYCLGVDYQDFTNKLTQSQLLPYFLDSPLYALCFYYFTGMNPAETPAKVKTFFDYYEELLECGPHVQPFPGDKNEEAAFYFALWEYRPDQKNKLHPEAPLRPRLRFLEEYTAIINDLDYQKLIKKFDDNIIFDELKEIFLLMFTNLGSFFELQSEPDDEDSYRNKFYDVSTSEGRKNFDFIHQIEQEGDDRIKDLEEQYPEGIAAMGLPTEYAAPEEKPLLAAEPKNSKKSKLKK